MRRNIITNFIFTNDMLKIVVLEKIKATVVEIYTAQSKIEEYKTLIQNSLLRIRDLIGVKISHVSIILEPYKSVEEKIQIVRETIKISNQIVQRQDIENLINLTKDKYENNLKKVILVQPIMFETHDIITKTFNRAPLHKKCRALSMTLAITTINKNVYNFIFKIIEHHQLKINQMLLTPQALSFNHISEHAQKFGSSLLSVNQFHSYITIVKNYGVVSLLKLNVGYHNLLLKISQSFECSVDEAKKILIVYSNLTSQVKSRIINLNSQIMSNYGSKTNVKLNEIVKQFMTNLFRATSTYLKQKLQNKYHNFPIVINGNITQINGLENYSKSKLKTEFVSMYSPLTYVETNKNNAYGLGLMKFMEKSDELGAIFYNQIVDNNLNQITETGSGSIVETNPSLDYLATNSLSQKSKGFLSKIWNRIGSNKYE